MSTNKSMRRIAALAAGGMSIVALAAVNPASANAAFATNSWIGSNSGGANIRTCGSTGCQSLGYLPNGTRVGMICWQDSQWVYPPQSDYASPRWFKVGT